MLLRTSPFLLKKGLESDKISPYTLSFHLLYTGNKKMKLKKDSIIGIVTLLVSAWIIWMTSQLPGTAYEGDPGPKMFPMIGGVLMAVCGLLLVIKPGPDSKAFLTKEQWGKCGIIFGAYVLFLVLMYVFGWTVGMPITLFVLTFILSSVSMPDASIKKRIITSLIWAVCCGAGIYLAYKIGLKARVPKGLLDKFYKSLF